MKNKFCIDSQNYEGIKTIFTEKQRSLKSDKHPELRVKNFIDRVRTAITNPSFVYLDLDKKNRYLYYYEELTLKEIGVVLEVSESRVCQIHTAALKKLRKAVREEV